jgi:flagellar hook-associated protein FlgK
MVSTLYAGSSAMQAYNKVMDITANNIANVNTAGYSTQGAVLSEASPESLSIRPVTGVKVATVAQPVDMDIYNTTVKHSNNVDIGA